MLAAEQTFARDGYEAARLEDIAARAGYTRGAFYANFESKEDIFFALLEQWVGAADCRGERVLLSGTIIPQAAAACFARALRADCKGPSAGFAVFGIQTICGATSRGACAFARAAAGVARCGGDILRRVMKSLGRSLAISSAAAATALGAFSHAMLLEHLVDGSSLSDGEIRHLLGLFFDAVVAGEK